MSGVPTIQEFDPRYIPGQYQVIYDVRKRFDYTDGKKELLLSGSIGSAKTLTAAHLAVTHCLLYPSAHVLIGRKTMPTLRDTLLQKIIDHLGVDVEFNLNISRGIITFPNGSKITSYSWADKQYKKVRSYDLSAAVIDELTENDAEEFYMEINNRLGRLPIKECWILCCTNPDSPQHWAYERFIVNKNPQRHVYYSVTTDNPFLPEHYIENLKKDLDPKMARRMLYGEWLEISQDTIYHAYSEGNKGKEYYIHPNYPIGISFDFNIGEGKPMSACLFQYILGQFHFFDEIILDGARTLDVLEELSSRSYFNTTKRWTIHGDATGRARDTRSIRSDYDIIKNFFDKHPRNPKYEICVPKSNPPVRTRHNIVNSYLKNELGQQRLTVYEKCKKLDKGLRLTALKKGGSYIEDDSKDYQHVTTALGYAVVYHHNRSKSKMNKITSSPR